MHTEKPVITVLFLIVELILYSLILTTGGNMLVWSSYISIIVCFLYAVIHIKKSNLCIVLGLLFTVFADFCLVVCNPIQRLWGMVFFMLAQISYAILLHRQNSHKVLLIVRVALTILIELVALMILGENTDVLALVSMAYYVNLIMNLICAFCQFRTNKLLAIGFLCFLLCDTVIGLQVAAGAYLPIAEGSAIYKLIFMDFNLAWFFYLPSQIMIALTAHLKSTQ